jgi:hypothetical protein
MAVFGGNVGRPVRFWAGGVIAAALAAALAGCASKDAAELLVDPGRYATYKCDDLAKRWKDMTKRETELRGLMDRAAQSNGGAVVGSLTYRVDYDETLSEERMLQRSAAEKNCNLPFQVPATQPTGVPPAGAPMPSPMPSGQPYGQSPSGQNQSDQFPTGQVQSRQPQSPDYTSDQSIR